MVMILSSMDKSVLVNSDSDCGGETRWFGFGFHGHVFGKVLKLVMVPESVKKLLVSKKKVEGGLVRQGRGRGIPLCFEAKGMRGKGRGMLM